VLYFLRLGVSYDPYHWRDRILGNSIVKKGLENGLKIKCLVRDPEKTTSVFGEPSEKVGFAKGDILTVLPDFQLEPSNPGTLSLIKIIIPSNQIFLFD